MGTLVRSGVIKKPFESFINSLSFYLYFTEILEIIVLVPVRGEERGEIS